MTTYKLKEETPGRTRKSYLKFVPMIFLAAVPALLLSYSVRNETPFVMYFMLFALVSAIVIAYFISIKQRATFLLTVNEDSIRLRQSGKGDAFIERNEIAKIIDEGSGLRIKSIDPSVEIFIPNDLEDYDKLKLELNTWAIIESGQGKKLRDATIIGFVILLIVGGYMTRNPIFFYIILGLGAAYLLYTYSLNFKTMMVTKDKWKRIRIIISFVLFGLIILSYLLKYMK